MARGYDNRETTRRSFAFAPQQGRQTRSAGAAVPTIGAQGNAGQAATGGGNVVMSENPTLRGDAGAAIPAFLEKTLEPIIQAQQERRVREGYTAAANGMAMEEIARNQPGLASIFGPTDFQRGAQYFATQTAVNAWKQEQIENLDKLAQLPEEDLPRYLDEAAMSHMTGDTFADNAIGAAIMEANTTLIPRIAQARVEWQQNTLARGARANNIAAGNAYGAMVASYVRQPELEEGQEDPLAGQRINADQIAQARDSFLAAILPIEGMSDTAFKASVRDTARAFLADGNLWAFNALDSGGTNSVLYQTLEPEELEQMRTQYKTAGKAAQAAAMMQVGEEYDLFRTQVRLGQVPPGDIRDRLEEFNVRIAVLSGYTEPYFDAEAMISQTEAGVDLTVRGIEADENRAYNEYRDDYNRQMDAEAEAAKEAQDLESIKALIFQGDAQAAKYTYTAAKTDLVLTQMIRQDAATTIPFLIRNHQNSTYISDGARDVLQAQVAANIAAGYDSESFQNAYKNWQTFSATPQGRSARAAYYGEYDTMFMNLQTRMQNVSPSIAYAQTFGEAGALAGTMRPQSAPTGERKERIEAAARSMARPNFWQRLLGPGSIAGDGFTPNSQAIITRMVQGGAAARMEADAALDADEAVKNELAALQGARRIEVVGRDAWANPTTGATMQELTQIPEDRIGRVWNDLVNEGLERVGAEGRPYTVWRQGTGPTTRWIVQTTSEDGETDVFQLDAATIKRHDTVTEQADVARRRPRNQVRPDGVHGSPDFLERLGRRITGAH